MRNHIIKCHEVHDGCQRFRQELLGGRIGDTALVQVLPLVPPEEEFWSPYTGLDALCGSTLVISLDELITEGLLSPEDLPPIVAEGTADFFAVCARRSPPCPLS